MFCLKIFIACRRKTTTVKWEEVNISGWDLESRSFGQEDSGGILPQIGGERLRVGGAWGNAGAMSSEEQHQGGKLQKVLEFSFIHSFHTF